MLTLYHVFSYCIGRLIFLNSAFILNPSLFLSVQYQLWDPKDVTVWSCSCPVDKSQWLFSIFSGPLATWRVKRLIMRRVHCTFWCWSCGMDSFSQRFQDVKHWPKRCETWAHCFWWSPGFSNSKFVNKWASQMVKSKLPGMTFSRTSIVILKTSQKHQMWCRYEDSVFATGGNSVIQNAVGKLPR